MEHSMINSIQSCVHMILLTNITNADLFLQNASELLENLGRNVPFFAYMDHDANSKSSTTYWYVTRREYVSDISRSKHVQSKKTPTLWND